MFRLRSVFVACAMGSCLVLAPTQLPAADGMVFGEASFEDGAPLTAGTITFHLKSGQFVGSAIDARGLFKVDGVPIGDWRVTLQAKGIAEEFRTEEKTPLKVTIKEGENRIRVIAKRK